MKLGDSAISPTTTAGKIWNFMLMTGEPTLTNYFSGASTVCMTIPGCTLSNCEISMIDPDLGTGCLMLAGVFVVYPAAGYQDFQLVHVLAHLEFLLKTETYLDGIVFYSLIFRFKLIYFIYSKTGEIIFI